MIDYNGYGAVITQQGQGSNPNPFLRVHVALNKTAKQ